MTRLRASHLAGLVALSACDDDGDDFDVSQQIGPDPVLPEPRQPLVASVRIAKVIGWQKDQTPDVAEGLTVSAYATDLANPRTVYTLPNGHVLLVQSRAPGGKPLERPKDHIRGWIMSLAKGGGGEQQESNLITLLCDTDRDGTWTSAATC